MTTPRPIVVSGPSGCGKSTILNKLFKEFPGLFGFSVSHTTRGPRPGEENGKDYNFVTREDMQSAIDNGEFLEHAEFGGNMYGTSKRAVSSVQSDGKMCILDLELAGVRSVKASTLGALFVYVQPPSYEILVRAVSSGQNEGKMCILDLELAGVRSVKASTLGALFVYVQPPSYEILVRAVSSGQNEGKMCILDLELAGVRSMKASTLGALFVYVQPPSLATKYS